MTNPEPDNPATATPDADPTGASAAHRSRRRRQAVIGATGMAAVLGAGGILMATQHRNSADVPSAAHVPASTTESPDAAGQAPDAAGQPPAHTAGSTPTSKSPASPLATAATPRTSEDVRKEVVAARKKAAADGFQVQRQMMAPKAATVADADISVVNTGDLRKTKSTLRVVAAHGDLSGQRELAWVANKGTPVGAARCSQQFRLANEAKPVTRPNLLICWRTTAKKSVYTVAVAVDGHPSQQASLAAITKKWTELG
ncbi:hypothetical protein HH310_08530 [Actinoplanes sp. TBRC 11911]|uniref:hypothetical protein n=1 Tax=Actinoplanes sp. TBRC 11911 TaxID=2729386 RepID=UPI00145DAD79|nr:hypothetical protein [Actinoplanes sp. TBRC 11911]NMO51231.1 hypothetical protein [Actinoplanes sp. TBRC 11911]